jgi:hypothetical protein
MQYVLLYVEHMQYVLQYVEHVQYVLQYVEHPSRNKFCFDKRYRFIVMIFKRVLIPAERLLNSSVRLSVA